MPESAAFPVQRFRISTAMGSGMKTRSGGQQHPGVAGLVVAEFDAARELGDAVLADDGAFGHTASGMNAPGGIWPGVT